MRETVNTVHEPYECTYPSEADTMPVGTVKITEYTQTGIVEAYVRANGQIDIANARLDAIMKFIQTAKLKERNSINQRTKR